MGWIRFEPQARFHAVYAEAKGGYWTWCGRFARELREGPTEEARGMRRCRHCRQRQERPYLLPDWLRNLAALKEAS